MCLSNLTTRTPIIAKEDIICYKQLKYSRCLAPIKDNSSFTGVIFGNDCNGVVSVEKEKYYFCTNSSFLNGTECLDKHGYWYSWECDDNVSSIIVGGEEKITKILVTRFRRFPVSIGETYKSRLILHKGKSVEYDDTIEIGIHSYTNEFNPRSWPGSGILVKCVIPKGSKYYIGTFDGDESYASDTLKYLELLKNKKCKTIKCKK